MRKKRRIEEKWVELATAIMPTLAPGDPQYDDMQKSFYAGALIMFHCIEAISNNPANSEDRAADTILALRNEVVDFLASVRQRSIERN